MTPNPPTVPNQIAALLAQSGSLQQLGKLQEALETYQRVLVLEPRNFTALHGTGIIYGQMRRFQEALTFFTAAVAAQPNDCVAYFNRGKVLAALKRHDQALADYDQALSLKPDFAEAHNNRGNTLKDLGRYQEALAAYAKAIAIRPDYVNAYNNQGAVLIVLLRYQEALASYDRLLSLKPDFVEAYNNRGKIYTALQRHQEALDNYDRLVALKPDSVAGHNNRATELKALKRYEEALAGYDMALSLKPDFAEAHNNRGTVLKEFERYQEALSAYDKAIAINPNIAVIHSNRGNLLVTLGRYHEALSCYDKALALNPDFAEANHHKALLNLLLGNFEQGWPLYEWRWKTGQLKDLSGDFKKPLWLGDPSPTGKTLLLAAEQGLGDTIQFVRYAPMVAALGATVILRVPAALVSLFRSLKGSFTLITEHDALPDYDLYCPLLSLPLAFKTAIDTIPANIPYLAVDPQKQSAWRERLGPKTKPRIGLTWSGNPNFFNDRHRSLALEVLAPLLSEDYEFHSLQKEVRSEDQALLENLAQIRTHEQQLHDFADTAALIAELELVISVDTAVAHLAGALGKTVWILLPADPDFRWLLSRSDSPWYPTARLFRQKDVGKWDEVIKEITSLLSTLS